MTDDGGADTMISTVDATALINELFEEEALVIGGLVAVHEMDDDLVWRLIQNFDVIRGQILRRSRTRPRPTGRRRSVGSPSRPIRPSRISSSR